MSKSTCFTYRYSETRYRKELICCFFNPFNTEWTIAVDSNGPLTGKGVDGLSTVFGELVKEKLKNKKHETKLVVFINDLGVVKLMIEQFDGKATQLAFTTIEDVKIAMEFETTHFQWRNFNSIAGTVDMADVKQLFPEEENLSKLMQKYILSFEEKWPVKNVRYSLAHMAKRKAFKNISDQCYNDMVERKIFFSSFDFYQDMFQGSKSGLLLKYNTNATIEKTWREYNTVYSYDKKSAYPSVIVNDKHFPLGKIRKINYRPIREMRDRMNNEQWCRIVIHSDKRIDFLSDMFKGRKDNNYSIEYCDLHVIAHNKEFYEKFLNYLDTHDNWSLYVSQETGYLLDCVREMIVEIYLAKDKIANKNDFQRFLLKSMLDMLYGKAIQNYDYTTLDEVNNHYRHHGENYLLPQHGIHCLSAVKCEIWKLQNAVGADSVIAFDTDGIRFNDTKVIDYINEINRQIKQRNKDAGFEGLNIGLWAEEYIADRFVQFAPKTYIYETNGKIEFKIAGVQKKEVDSFLQTTPDPITHLLTQGHTFKLQGPWIYDSDKKLFKPTYNDYELRPRF